MKHVIVVEDWIDPVQGVPSPDSDQEVMDEDADTDVDEVELPQKNGHRKGILQVRDIASRYPDMLVCMVCGLTYPTRTQVTAHMSKMHKRLKGNYQNCQHPGCGWKSNTVLKAWWHKL